MTAGKDREGIPVGFNTLAVGKSSRIAEYDEAPAFASALPIQFRGDLLTSVIDLFAPLQGPLEHRQPADPEVLIVADPPFIDQPNRDDIDDRHAQAY